MATPERKAQAEFSRIVEAERAAAGSLRLELAATAQERHLLAERLGLEALRALSAEAVLTAADAKGAVRVALHWQADIQQACVVTLEPIETRFDEQIELRFVAGTGALAAGDEQEIIVGIDSEDPPEVMVGGKIDLGGIVAEQLALHIDPYPRKAGADLSAVWRGPVADEDRVENAFAALRRLGEAS